MAKRAQKPEERQSARSDAIQKAKEQKKKDEEKKKAERKVQIWCPCVLGGVSLSLTV